MKMAFSRLNNEHYRLESEAGISSMQVGYEA